VLNHMDGRKMKRSRSRCLWGRLFTSSSRGALTLSTVKLGQTRFANGVGTRPPQGVSSRPPGSVTEIFGTDQPESREPDAKGNSAPPKTTQNVQCVLNATSTPKDQIEGEGCARAPPASREVGLRKSRGNTKTAERMRAQWGGSVATTSNLRSTYKQGASRRPARATGIRRANREIPWRSTGLERPTIADEFGIFSRASGHASPVGR